VAQRDKKHILTLSGFLHNNDIKGSYFRAYALENKSWLPSCRQKDDFDVSNFQDILKELHKLSVLESLQPDASFSLHSLIQDWIKLRIDSESRKMYTTEAHLVLELYLSSLWKEGDYIVSLEEFQDVQAHITAAVSNRE
jgi:hypothetical protein